MRIVNRILALGRHHYVRLFSYPTNCFPTSLSYEDYWKERRSTLTFRLGLPQQLRYNKLKQLVDWSRVKSVVDVGGAEGSFLHFLQSDYPSLQRVTCVDTSEYALEFAAANGIETLHIDLSKPDKLRLIHKADLVYALEVLEHIPNSEELLKIMYESANEYVVFSFPNTGFITYRIRMLLGKTPMQWVMHPAEHLRFWTWNDVSWWMRAQGYKNYTLHSHRGLYLLNKVLPSLFSADIFVVLKK